MKKISKRPLVGPARYHMRVFTNPHTLLNDADIDAWKLAFPQSDLEEISCDFLAGNFSTNL